MQNLLNTYNEKLEKLEAEQKKSTAREREARQNKDQVTRLYWNQSACRLVAQIELCIEVISDIEREMAK